MKSIKGKVLFVGIVGFIILFIAQVLLFEERTILDTAHSVFFIANDRDFDATQMRYAIALNQMLPVAYTYIGSSIKGVITAYYINDFLWYLSFFLLFLFGFKKPAAALALIVGYFTSLGVVYFITTNCIALTWPILILLSLVLTGQILQDHKVLRWLVALICIFFMAFSNPINSVTTMLFLAYFLAQVIEQKKPKGEILASIAIFLVFAFIKNINPDPYDVGKLSDMKSFDVSWINMEYVLEWAGKYIIMFPMGLLMLFVGAIFTYKKLKGPEKLSGLVLVMGFAFFLLVSVVYGVILRWPQDDMVAKTLVPTVFLFCYLLSEKIVQKSFTQKPWMANSAMALFVFFFLLKFSFLITVYCDLAQFKLSVCKQMLAQAPSGAQKLYVTDAAFEHLPDVPQPPFTIFEVLLIDALQNNGPYNAHITFEFTENLPLLLNSNDNDKLYHSNGWFVEVEENSKFFKFNFDKEWEAFHPQLTIEEK